MMLPVMVFPPQLSLVSVYVLLKVPYLFIVFTGFTSIALTNLPIALSF